MIKSELIEKLAMENTHLTHAEVERLVNAILNTMTTALSDGGRVELRLRRPVGAGAPGAGGPQSPHGRGGRGAGQGGALLQERQGAARATERSGRRLTRPTPKSETNP